MVNTRPLAVRFWEKVIRGGPDDCWPWRFARPRRYGSIWVDGRQHGAHRVALFLAGRMPLDERVLVRHTCDNPPCCNPAHLLVGTRQQNADDAVERGRVPKGEGRVNAVLTEAAVREIRAAPRSRGLAVTLAAKFGVSPSTIQQVRSRTAWAWLPDDPEV